MFKYYFPLWLLEPPQRYKTTVGLVLSIGQAKELMLSEAEAATSWLLLVLSLKLCKAVLILSLHLEAGAGVQRCQRKQPLLHQQPLQMELELLSYEGTLDTSDVSFYHARRRRDLGHPFLFSLHIWCVQSQFCLCCWETLIRLAAARAGVRFLVPEEGMLHDPVLSGRKCLCLNPASLQMGLWGAKPSTDIHCMKQIQVCEWPERDF